MLTFSQYLIEQQCAIISREQMKQFETLVDRIFEKFGIDFEFTMHFRDRMGDDRNNPCISMKELADFFSKIYAKKGAPLKNTKDAEVVLTDLQKDLNIPVLLSYNSRTDELEVKAKTIMRKKNFHTLDKKIRY